MSTSRRIAVAPNDYRGHSGLVAAVQRGGAKVVEPSEAEAIVWIDPRKSSGLQQLMAEHSAHVDWVQLVFAGIEPFAHLLDDRRVWTSGKDVYSEPVAEHALGLALAGMRGLVGYARASQWEAPEGQNLYGANVVIVGGGGITRALLALLAPFRTRVTVVRRTAEPVQGAGRVVSSEDLPQVLPDADLVVLALALTKQTRHIIDADALRLMRSDAWLVNVARGAHVDTEALTAALSERRIGGAALDVTDPEPLPGEHPLWTEPRCLITPHVGNTPEMAVPLLHARVTENVRRFVGGQPLIGVADPELGY